MANIESEEIVFDNNGYPVMDRKNIIYNAIIDTIDGIDKRYEEEYQKLLNVFGAKPYRKKVSTFQIKAIVYKACQSLIGQVDNKIALTLTRQQLENLFADFLDFIAELNIKYAFVPSKQIFNAFAGISASAYENLLQNGDDEQKEVMSQIDNAIIDLSLDASASGIIKESTTKFRMQAKGSAGHSIRTANATDTLLENMGNSKTPSDYTRILEGITLSLLESKEK